MADNKKSTSDKNPYPANPDGKVFINKSAKKSKNTK
ncbi:hypothetical protein MBORA_16090 [Methanobrevibacter oralis]|uniref:Uncharacterized protein n=1 Tax=Methanobrevibacter oralis TaxID=66851 RepID=A0A165ZZA3_METOA|nr:hypothetical protein MBORA_16090 [Methanobrevibacter oralis]